VAEVKDEPASLSRARKAVLGGAFGFFVDNFDIYLPTIALVPATSYFTPKEMSANTSAVIAALIFVATLLGRPVGSAIFGWFADRAGRRRVTLVAVAGCGVCTALIAALPGYTMLGTASVILLIALRFIDGVFIGGEYTGATPLAMEATPPRRRGWYGALIAAGGGVANTAMSGLTFVVLQFAPEGGSDAPYSVWGWRIPFLFGTLLSVVFLVYYSRTVGESDAWKAARKAKNPLREIIFGRGRRDFAQIFVLMTGIWFASVMATGFLPTALKQDGKISATGITAVLFIAQGAYTLIFPFVGKLSDNIGRRKVLLLNGVAIALLCAGSFAALAAGWCSGFAAILIVAFIVRFSGVGVFAIVPAYLCERFPPATRGSGYGLGYSAPLLITSFYAYYQNWLGSIMPRSYTPSILLAIGGALVICAALLGPETLDRFRPSSGSASAGHHTPEVGGIVQDLA
jgi:MFS family permease